MAGNNVVNIILPSDKITLDICAAYLRTFADSALMSLQLNCVTKKQLLDAQIHPEKYPDLRLYRGNELRYNRGCVEWVKEGKCHSLNDTNYVLIDFSQNEEGDVIVKGTNRILSAGYIPVLAHVERYRRIAKDMDFIRELRENGVIIQVDAQSILGVFGIGSKRCCKRMLAHHLVDAVATDAHGSLLRPPSITESYRYIEKYFGKKYAETVCVHNPYAILQNRRLGKE